MELSKIEQGVYDQLKEVIDPELQIDLVNLGLIYDIDVSQTGHCLVTMTLTTMGCPLVDELNSLIKQAVLSVAGVVECEIKLVWEPVWDPSKMTRYARIALGIH